MKHLPNALTLARLVLSILMFVALAVVGALQAPPEWAPALIWFSVAAFFIAAITDFFDGWLARRWQAASLMGAILDPIADKILVCGAILGLMAVHARDMAIAGGVILFREFAVSALREVLAPMGLKLPVTFLAKTKTTVQLVALGVLMIIWFWPVWGIPASFEQMRTIYQTASLAFDAAAALTVWTGVEYAMAARRLLRK